MLGLKRRDLVIWCVYLVMLAIAVPRHEPWNDEAQAWLLIRDSSLLHLLLHGLRYESHPPLWYLILWLPTHLHLSYAIFCWIAAAIAAAGIYVFLRLSPFPFYLRATLPFTFFLAYQYAVVARSYVLFPLLCFLIAHIYRKAKPQPVLMAVLLALLANVSVHGTLIACAVAVAYAWNLARRRPAASTRSLVAAASIFLASIALVAFTVFPPKDLTSVATPTVLHVLHLPQNQASVPSTAPSPTASSTSNTPAATPKGGLRSRLAEIPRVLSYSISTSHLLVLLLYLLTALFLYRRKQLLLLAPLAVLALFLAFIYAREWHLGLLWVTLLMVLWAAWNTQPDTRLLTLQNALCLILLIASLLQLPWTWRALRYDIHQQYSGATQTAAYLHTLPPSLRIAGFAPQSTAILPYFPHNIFFNQTPAAYWRWSTHNLIDSEAPQSIDTHPDLVVLFLQYHSPLRPDANPILDYAQASGYRETHRFCGHMFLPNLSGYEQGCYLILQPSSTLP